MSRTPVIHSVACLLLLTCLVSCAREKSATPPPRQWSEQEIQDLRGKTREDIRALLGAPNGFYTRNAEGRWHYSDLHINSEGAGESRRVWIVIYFSQFGDQRATLVEIHDHAEQEH